MKKNILLFLFLLLPFNVNATINSVGTRSTAKISGGIYNYLMPLGDSITYGTGNGSGGNEQGYRFLLQDNLGIGVYSFVGAYQNPASSGTYDVDHDGVVGEETSAILTRLSSDLTNYMPAYPANGLVLLHAGTNNANHGASSSDAVADIASMISAIHSHNSNLVVYVALIVPSTNGGTNGRINTTNTLLKAELDTERLTDNKLHYVDMNTAFLNDTFGYCSGDWAANCMSDFLHPDIDGYHTMADMWSRCINNPSASLCDGH